MARFFLQPLLGASQLAWHSEAAHLTASWSVFRAGSGQAAALRTVCSPTPTAVFLLSAEIQKLVLEGRVGEAIETTQHFYPGLLEHNPNLLFMLK